MAAVINFIVSLPFWVQAMLVIFVVASIVWPELFYQRAPSPRYKRRWRRRHGWWDEN